MDSAKFAVFVLFSLTCGSAAFESTAGDYGNHEKWLKYSRALSNSLSSEDILKLHDTESSPKMHTTPCVDGEDCNDRRSLSISEESETPMSMLFLNLDDLEIPFPVVKDVLHLNKNHADRGKFVAKKAVVFSFVNKTALREIDTSGHVDPKDDPMVIALFLPVDFHANKPLTSTPKHEIDAEWPRFFKTLLTEMAASNVTSQNLLQLLMPNSMPGVHARQIFMQNSPPDMDAQQPFMSNSPPGMYAQQPSMSNFAPGIDVRQPFVSNSAPGMDARQPLMPDAAPNMDAQQPSMPNSPPGMDGRQPFMSTSLPGINVRQPLMPNAAPDMDAQQSSMPNSPPGVDGRQPFMSTSLPGINVRQPLMPDAAPDMDVQQPSKQNSPPGMDERQPLMPNSGLDMSAPHLFMANSPPVIDIQQPLMANSPPAIDIQQPLIPNSSPQMDPQHPPTLDPETPPATDARQASYEEAMRIVKDHNFPDTDVTLYFFRTPHVTVPPKYVKKVITEAEVPLAAGSLSRFEVNEVYLMTVANETAGKALREELDGNTGAPLTTPVVLSFIIPVDFKTTRKTLPRAKLAGSPPMLVPGTGARIVPLTIMPIPMLVDLSPRFSDLIRRQYLSAGVRGSGSPGGVGVDTVNLPQGSPRRNPEGVRPRPTRPQGSSDAGAYHYLSAPPATAPGGIASALQP
ncbi:unnamed protein product [Bemisia tabaci]|uniref:Uncharacterized protein n=1 Tax=Bemisia tabaci TaxID=7038 RepID=A0A9P0F511_BEMTA|nr:unnamed protein product [Bemisia tabaci]